MSGGVRRPGRYGGWKAGLDRARDGARSRGREFRGRLAGVSRPRVDSRLPAFAECIGRRRARPQPAKGRAFPPGHAMRFAVFAASARSDPASRDRASPRISRGCGHIARQPRRGTAVARVIRCGACRTRPTYRACHLQRGPRPAPQPGRPVAPSDGAPVLRRHARPACVPRSCHRPPRREGSGAPRERVPQPIAPFHPSKPASPSRCAEAAEPPSVVLSAAPWSRSRDGSRGRRSALASFALTRTRSAAWIPVAPSLFLALVVALARPARAQFGMGSPDDPDTPITAPERAAVVESLAVAVQRYYVFPDKGAELAKALRRRYAQHEYDRITSSKEFADSLLAHMQAVHARPAHARPLPRRARSRRDARGRACPTAERRRSIEAERVRNFGFERVQRLAGNVGYLDLRSFSGRPDAQATAIGGDELPRQHRRAHRGPAAQRRRRPGA